MGVRDELWGNGQVFTAEGETRSARRRLRGDLKWGVLTPALLQGLLSLWYNDIKPPVPSVQAASRPCLVNSWLNKTFLRCN